jgi:hypothetical protein
MMRKGVHAISLTKSQKSSKSPQQLRAHQAIVTAKRKKAGAVCKPHFHQTDLKDFFKRGEKGPGPNWHEHQPRRTEPKEEEFRLPSRTKPNKPTKTAELNLKNSENKRRTMRAATTEMRTNKTCLAGVAVLSLDEAPAAAGEDGFPNPHCRRRISWIPTQQPRPSLSLPPPRLRITERSLGRAAGYFELEMAADGDVQIGMKNDYRIVGSARTFCLFCAVVPDLFLFLFFKIDSRTPSKFLSQP